MPKRSGKEEWIAQACLEMRVNVTLVRWIEVLTKRSE
jgi:hypothetical protein